MVDDVLRIRDFVRSAAGHPHLLLEGRLEDIERMAS
jgi:hypothetical protein